ncbi:MarR family EPS-associated transcriptional regulator [Sulfuriflexus mobilis]|uniref:MarR family EPS-associated transcriptional regulator n=1 Tax=Sulfuriflexus mobilis TaxID=1811807 RepID=UPI000F8198BA|nr:MarR family EPS-associated transcriptional regulator [Sulfuriflexus mobilis]
MNEEISYRVIKLIEQNPEISQRQLAEELGVSLGKTNYCLKALIEKGHIKASNFKNSHNKLAYSYLLTPEGIKEKVRITASFLKRKLAEFDALQNEIETLKQEVTQSSSSSEI